MPEIQATTNTIVPGLDLKKIRKTNETPPRVSVIDLIAVISKTSNPRKTWGDLKKNHPEVVTSGYNFQDDYKFAGQGQSKSPIINATGAITIINLLPGQLAASFRAEWASIIVRYLGGDRTLIDEVEANHYQQQQLPDDDPQRFFGQTVERDGVIRRLRTGEYPKEAFTVAMTNQNIVQSGEIDLTAPQGYLGVAENVKVPAGIVPPGGIVGHFGHTHNEPTQRLMAHNGKFGFFRFIRHFPCANAYGLEQKWKAFLRVKGRLIPVLRADGNVDYESFWVHNLQEWMKFEEEFQKMCDKLVDFICRTEEKRLELKIKEAEIAISLNEARKAEADTEARKAEAEASARRAEAETAACQAKLDFERWQIEWANKHTDHRNPTLSTAEDRIENDIRNSCTPPADHHESGSTPPNDISRTSMLKEDCVSDNPKGDPQESTNAAGNVTEDVTHDQHDIVDDNTVEPADVMPIDMFADYTREKRVKKPVVAPTPEARQRTTKPKVKPLDLNKQETIDVFIAECCETGTDQKPIRDVVTQHFFEPQTSLHSVYTTYTSHRTPPRTAVKYTDFVQGLAARGIVQEFRTYPVKRNKPKGPCNRPLMSFVGIRLKNRPPSDLEREIAAFVSKFTEIVQSDIETPMTTISAFFKSFNAKYPGWTAYHVNQSMLSGGYKIATHRSKGERAWINLRLTTPNVTSTASSG